MKNRMLLYLMLNLILIGCNNTQTKNGVTYYEQKLNSPTNNADALKFYTTGYYEFQKENYNDAIINYKKAFQIDTNYTDAIDNCALSFRRLNLLDSAEYYYKLSIKKLPKNELAWSNLALVYQFKGDYSKAKLTFKELLEFSPKCGDAYYGLAEIFLKENNNDSAITFSLKAYDIWLDNNPEFAGDAIFYAGLGYLQKGNKKNANDYFIIANKLGRNISPEIQAQLKE